MRQFGGRVNNPTTSLGDLNSKFTIQGDPTLPRLTVSGYFTGQTSIAGPDAGSDYFSVKDSVSMSRGNHSFKFGGEVSYEKIVHDTLLDNYGVFSVQRQQDRQRLRRLPARPAGDDDAGRADPKDRQRRLHQPVRAGRLPRPPARDAEPRRPLRPAVPLTDPQDRKLAFVPGAQSQVSPTAPRACSSPAIPASAAASSRPTTTTSRRASASRGIPAGDGRDVGARRRGIFYGSITGNEWNTTADNQPFTVRQSFPTVFTLSDPYRQPARRRRSVPVQLRSGQPALHAAGAGVRSVARLRVAVHLPDEPDGREGDASRSFSVSASYVGALGRNLPASIDRNYPVFGPARRPPTSTRAGPYQPGVIGAGARARVDLQRATTTACR